VTDANGRVPIKDHVPGTPTYKVRLTNGAEFQLKVSPTLDPRSAEKRLSNAGFRGASAASRADDYPSAT
jgi:type VI secretion system secreted protein VgrG